MMIAVVAVVSACQQPSRMASSQDEVDSLFDAAIKVRNYDRLLTLADSLETAEAIPAIEANFRRGYAYHKKKQYGSAESYYHMVQATTPKLPLPISAPSKKSGLATSRRMACFFARSSVS